MLGSDTSNSDTMVSAEPDQLVVATSSRFAVEQQLVRCPPAVRVRRRRSASATDTMRTPSFDATYTKLPSVSTTSPSSTPTSCVLVPENPSSGAAAERRMTCPRRPIRWQPCRGRPRPSPRRPRRTSSPPPFSPHAVTRSDAASCMYDSSAGQSPKKFRRAEPKPCGWAGVGTVVDGSSPGSVDGSGRRRAHRIARVGGRAVAAATDRREQCAGGECQVG